MEEVLSKKGNDKNAHQSLVIVLTKPVLQNSQETIIGCIFATPFGEQWNNKVKTIFDIEEVAVKVFRVNKNGWVKVQAFFPLMNHLTFQLKVGGALVREAQKLLKQSRRK